MKLTEWELERIQHLETKKFVLRLQGEALDRDAGDLFASIRARLGMMNDQAFGIAADGTVTPSDSPATAPADQARGDQARAEKTAA